MMKTIYDSVGRWREPHHFILPSNVTDGSNIDPCLILVMPHKGTPIRRVETGLDDGLLQKLLYGNESDHVSHCEGIEAKTNDIERASSCKNSTICGQNKTVVSFPSR